jgi:hypothetical protein
MASTETPGAMPGSPPEGLASEKDAFERLLLAKDFDGILSLAVRDL